MSRMSRPPVLRSHERSEGEVEEGDHSMATAGRIWLPEGLQKRVARVRLAQGVVGEAILVYGEPHDNAAVGVLWTLVSEPNPPCSIYPNTNYPAVLGVFVPWWLSSALVAHGGRELILYMLEE